MENSPHQQQQKRWRERRPTDEMVRGWGWGGIVPGNRVAPGKHKITRISSGPS